MSHISIYLRKQQRICLDVTYINMYASSRAKEDSLSRDTGACYGVAIISRRRSLLQRSPIILRSLLIVANMYAPSRAKEDSLSRDTGACYGVAKISRLRSLLQKSPVKETIFCKKRPIILRGLLSVVTPYAKCVTHIYRPSRAKEDMGWLRLVGSLKL